MRIIDINEFEEIEGTINTPIRTIPTSVRATCESCDWEGFTDECELTEDSEDWENPTYLTYTCPICGEGVDC